MSIHEVVSKKYLPTLLLNVMTIMMAIHLFNKLGAKIVSGVVLRCKCDTSAEVDTLKVTVISQTNSNGKRVPERGGYSIQGLVTAHWPPAALPT